MFESFNAINRWQIIQHDLNNIEFIIKVKMNETILDEQLIVEIYKRLPKSINIKISRDKYFVQKNEGKINPFTSYI